MKILVRSSYKDNHIKGPSMSLASWFSGDPVQCDRNMFSPEEIPVQSYSCHEVDVEHCSGGKMF